GQLTRAVRWCRRNPWPSIGTAALLLLITVTISSAVVLSERHWRSLLQQADQKLASGQGIEAIATLRRAYRIHATADVREAGLKMFLTPGARSVLQLPYGDIASCRISGDSRLVAIAGFNDRARRHYPERSWNCYDVTIWEYRSQKEIQHTRAASGKAIAFRPGGQQLA